MAKIMNATLIKRDKTILKLSSMSVAEAKALLQRLESHCATMIATMTVKIPTNKAQSVKESVPIGRLISLIA